MQDSILRPRRVLAKSSTNFLYQEKRRLCRKGWIPVGADIGGWKAEKTRQISPRPQGLVVTKPPSFSASSPYSGPTIRLSEHRDAISFCFFYCCLHSTSMRQPRVHASSPWRYIKDGLGFRFSLSLQKPHTKKCSSSLLLPLCSLSLLFPLLTLPTVPTPPTVPTVPVLRPSLVLRRWLVPVLSVSPLLPVSPC